MSDHDFDVVDLHHAFRRQTSNRADDGIHWNDIVHRAVTIVLLRHVCDAWHVEVPTSDGLLSEPPRRRPVCSLLRHHSFDSQSRSHQSVGSSNDYGRRPRPWQNRRQVTTRQPNAADDECGGFHNDLVRFGCQLQQMLTDFNQNWNGVRQFGNNLTNRGQPRQTARRGRRGLQNYQNYRHCPY